MSDLLTSFENFPMPGDDSDDGCPEEAPEPTIPLDAEASFADGPFKAGVVTRQYPASRLEQLAHARGWLNDSSTEAWVVTGTNTVPKYDAPEAYQNGFMSVHTVGVRIQGDYQTIDLTATADVAVRDGAVRVNGEGELRALRSMAEDIIRYVNQVERGVAIQLENAEESPCDGCPDTD
jgi:hypothetical protein